MHSTALKIAARETPRHRHWRWMADRQAVDWSAVLADWMPFARKRGTWRSSRKLG